MSLAILRWTTLVTMLCACASGCSYFQGAANDDDVDLTEIDEEEKGEPGESSRIATLQESAPVEVVKEVMLKVGDRFPFSKSVEHRLTQIDQEGTHVNSSRTDVMLLLVVDNVTPDGRKLMTVQFQRVQFVQDILGKRIAYSSDESTVAIPPDASLYAGLVNNGFSFWVGPNNRVTDVVGYTDFLRRSLRNVPDQSKATVQRQLEAMKSIDGIANFIDESIGLLTLSSDPKHSGSAKQKGEIWELEPRYSDVPIPMVTSTRCILKELTAETAEILLTGHITGSLDPVTMHDAEGELKVFVKGGHCTGSCRINPQTGLPTQSQIQRSLELVVEFPDGYRMEQNKDTVSKLSLIVDPMQTPITHSDSRVQQTGIQNGIGSESARRIVPAGFSRPN